MPEQPQASQRGRRPGDPAETRDNILDAARGLFAEAGFDKASIRRIAARAQVDPALIHHHFGTKQQLFIAAMRAPVNPVDIVKGIIDGPPSELGHRIAEAFVGVWDSPAGTGLAHTLRAVLAQDGMTIAIREFVNHQLVPVLITALDGDEQERRFRANLALSQLLGLAVTRYLVRIEPIADVPATEVVRHIAPTLQHYLTGPLDAD
ncbi:TetR family transcriptional regulator [Hoyosella sp. G463]|uniref:TetR family transcriptional regulator n=1 Tax=Lolliginicoccus lacisalsi TaxID=2742202 RepID=A0A927JB64_9ACTN|nr:TetR family transcriptional regulator [Lolliginicoccus lacisalsi]MBD8506064.1 TetR family transcriptional regulator [Lolliginicoccus lacisalsi]